MHTQHSQGHSQMQQPPSGVRSRLDEFRLDERCAVDALATEISRHLYNRHYDQLPRSLRVKVEGAALRAIRSPQLAWNREAWLKAYGALEDAMRREMGADFAQMPAARRATLAHLGAQAVLTALVSIFEVEQPFEDVSQALRVYDTARAQAREAW